MNAKGSTTNSFSWRPDPRRYIPPIRQNPSQGGTYGPPNRYRITSRKGQVEGVDLLHSTKAATPQGRSLMNSPRPQSPSNPVRSLQEVVEKLPNDRIRIACLELAYRMCKDGQTFEDGQAALIALVQRITEELNKLMLTIAKLQRAQKKERLQPINQENQSIEKDLAECKQQLQRELEKACKSEHHSPPPQNRIQLENARLAAINRTLAAKVKQLTEQVSQCSSDAPKETISAIDQATLEAADRCHYLDIKLQNEEKKNAQLTGELEAATAAAKQAIEAYEAKKRMQEEQTNSAGIWRERAMMLQEDNLAKADREQMMLDFLSRLKDRRSMTDQPCKRISSQPRVQVAMRNETFRHEQQFLQSIREDDSKTPQYRHQLRCNNDDLGTEVGSLEQEMAALRARKQEGDSYLPQYSYWRPTFYNMIEHLPNEPQARRNGEINREFVQKLRGILNSKLNEFMLVESTSYTRFPEFVLGWLNLYDFEPSTGEVMLRNSDETSPTPKFYSDLMNFKLDQTWEVVTFREFLLEKLSLEELYFYLMCQNVLYRRAAITLEKQYFGELTIMVELGIARSVMYTIMSEFDSTNIEYFLGRLSERAVLRSGKQVIESGFLLRCLLECYKIERLNRYKFISRVCREQLASEDPNDRHSTGKIDFSKTMKIFGLFDGIAYPTKLALYRECYSVSRGNITPEVIFTVLTEQRVFLEALRIRTFHRLPMMLRGSEDCSMIQPSLSYLPPVFQRLRDFLAPGSDFSQHVLTLGVDSINQKIELFRSYFLQKKFYTDNWLMKCKHFLHFLAGLAAQIREINSNSLYDVLEDVDHRANYFSIKIDENSLGELSLKCLLPALDEYNKTRALIDWKVRVREFRAKIAARKIQRHVREKFIKPYLQLYNNMLAKAKTVIHQQMSSTAPIKAFQELKRLKSRNISLATKYKVTS